jgi:mitochondrial fission protein ELM1
MPDPIVIWAVSDGRSGIENQAAGLAEAVARLVPARVEIKRIAWKGRTGRLPAMLNLFPRRWLEPESGALGPPWPDLWIAAGRATLPLSMRVRKWSAGKTLVVQTQDPRLPPRLFDLVLPPRHDRLVGDNVFSLTGSPHRVTAERLEAEAARFADRLDALPGPKVAILVGGRSRAFDLPAAHAEKLAQALDLALEAEQASVLLTFSRRTPEAAKAVLTEHLSRRPGMIWDGEGDNPYFAFLAAADFVLVTEDSINMAAEAASTGKPVFILPMQGRSVRIRRFHEDLEARGAARPFGGRFYRWSYEPLRETERAAAEIVRRLQAR